MVVVLVVCGGEVWWRWCVMVVVVISIEVSVA